MRTGAILFMENYYPDFISDKAFIEMNSSVSEVDQLRAMLGNITRIHNLTFKNFDDFDKLIEEYLQTGIEIFKMETGIVSHIREDNIYYVCDVISPLSVLEKHMEFPLEETYCREVIKTQNIIGIPEVGSIESMRSHPVYQNLKLEAYLSAPIYVDDQLFGTLNFTSTHSRENGFSQNEFHMIKIMANAIGAYISLRNKEDKLLKINEKMKLFVGHVSHDLRNPIGAIISLTKLAKMPKVTMERINHIFDHIQTSAETALELVSSILDEAALSTGKINLINEKKNLAELFEKSKESVSDFSDSSGNEIVLDIEADLFVVCDPNRMHQCINNLIINAIKYSPSNSKIIISSEKSQEQCIVKIKNKVNSDKSAPKHHDDIYKSVGFGLDIVKTILKAHKSDLATNEKDGEYSAIFSLQLG